MNLESLADTLLKMIPAVSDAPGKGLLAFVKTSSQAQIRKLALRVAASHPAGLTPVYMVQGRLIGEHGWPFSRIKKGPRIRLDVGDGVTESGGTIFPEDRPIVLLAEDFDYFDPRDQRAYCHLVDGEGYSSAAPCSLHQGSVLLCGFTGDGTIESGSISRGVVYELDQ